MFTIHITGEEIQSVIRFSREVLNVARSKTVARARATNDKTLAIVGIKIIGGCPKVVHLAVFTHMRNFVVHSIPYEIAKSDLNGNYLLYIKEFKVVN